MATALSRTGKVALILGAIAGASIEWFWTGRAIKNAKEKIQAAEQQYYKDWGDERQMLSARRSYNIKILAAEIEEADVQLAQLAAAADDAGVNTGLGGSRQPYARSAQQDQLEYDEFRQPDTNGDNVISKKEFNQYIRKYLSMYPDTADADIPRFEDFDLDQDGQVTFAEWQLYLDRQRQTEEYAESELMRGMYDNTARSQGFDSMAQNMQRQHGRGGGRY